ncbi:serine/threonine-protein kinase [Actinomycetospora chibensis]|uniref:non-specific serine/threonine protein kinase n=1 Tax=Actinomycetospora chibensis TaxID=663606 RepID=A0ABV9RIM3_9PSEU|nr:serine/threonine-protein kinase [Actinomycetospora chibensis]MDD7923325.1 serine/threonine-protein kinase [Actinomycetospora chibensis]
MSITLPPRQPATDVELFGPYRLGERLGGGGTGEVFRAYDTVRERTVALKRLRPDLSDDEAYAEHVLRTTRLAARLASPHVIPIHDVGTIDGALFVDTALVAGGDLARELAEHGPLGTARAAAVVRRVADALDDAHADGVVHGALTASNVLLSHHCGRDVVHLTDFGVAGPGGTRADDVHALGCLLVEALTGRPAFPDDDPWTTAGRRYDEPPRVTDRRRGLPSAVDAVVARALAPSPADRYACAGDLADAAHTALTGPRTAGARLDPGRGTTGSLTAPSTGGRKSGGAQTGGGQTGGGQAGGGPAGGTPAVRYVPAAAATSATAAPAWPLATVPAPREATSPQRTPDDPGSSTGPAALAPLPRGPRRSRRPGWIAMGAVLLMLVALLASWALLASGGTAPAPTPPVPPVEAPATSRLAAAFPDIAAPAGSGPGSTCSSYPAGDGEYVTSTGARALSVIRCDYGAAVPGGYVYYTEWPSAADARRWQADQASRGPALDGVTQWHDGPGAPQGPLHTHASPDGTVYATAAYAERPFSFDIVTRTPEASQRMFPAMRLLPAAQVPA